jgi:transcriptional regulator with XRE-family HTH domain
MKPEGFGEFIRRVREEKRLPLRKVAAHLDIDTSTLSKIERGERPASTEYLKPLSMVLEIDLKVIQTSFIADRINKDFGELEHLTEGLKQAEKQIKSKKK